MAQQIDDGLLEAWGEALDYKVDCHIKLFENKDGHIKLKDPVKRKKAEALYKKAERVCDRLEKEICTQK